MPSTRGRPGSLDEVDDLTFGPIPIVFTGPRSDKSAVATMLFEVQSDAGVVGQPRIAEGARWDERIVFGRDDQRRDADAIDDPHRACSMVVVFGIREPEVRRRIRLVEIADRL